VSAHVSPCLHRKPPPPPFPRHHHKNTTTNLTTHPAACALPQRWQVSRPRVCMRPPTMFPSCPTRPRPGPLPRAINKCVAFFGDNSLEDDRLRAVVSEVRFCSVFVILKSQEVLCVPPGPALL
jgi:hypothetical protein